MILSNEHRLQFFYFFLSGVVASALLILVYISMRTTIHDQFKEDLKLIQKTLTYIKPSSSPSWQYNNSWKHIGNATKRHAIYSAYFDARTDIIENLSVDSQQIPIGSVRIFAILPTYLVDTISCIIRFDDFTLKEIKAEEALAMHEHHDELFAAYTIMCPLLNNRAMNTVRLPQDVAIAYASNRLSHLSPSFVQISYPRKIEQIFAKSRPAIAICVAPLQQHYADVLRIVEFVEMYRILGASHFYFYHLDASEDVMQLLDYYRSIGLADILEWNLSDHTEDLHYSGIVAQYNECTFRAMVVDNYRYAAIVDLDEIIVPLKHNSLMDFLRQCDEGRTSAFVFRNVFYHRKDSNDTFSVPLHARNRMLYTQTKVRRTVEIMPAYHRSKCVVNTRSVIEMGNHQMWRSLSAYTDNVVHSTVGLLFHYRDKCINCKAVLMVDYTARRFGSLIWDRVDEICLQVFVTNGGICPVS